MHRLLNLVLSLSMLAAPVAQPPAQPVLAPAPQSATADAILASMTTAERVGQLFMVSFYGTNTAEGSDVYRLITNYHIGGVVLSAANDNITNTLQAPQQVLTLTNALQATAVTAAQVVRPSRDDPATSQSGPYVPLLIALNHEGNGYPFSDLRSGVTELPSAMAIGATWDPTQAESMGRIAGTELAALGVNVLLGPTLDVLDTPRPDGTDLGARAFGGDPYWVGVMGQAFIRGVHAGAGGSVAVIAKHFPGHGGSERRPDLIPTVRRSYEQLLTLDLVPFFAVMESGSAKGTADGILAGHIRYQGFQGDIRQVTPPVSLDAQALGQLLALPAIAAWRANGGVTFSDSLGVTAVKRFFDPALAAFNQRRIAGQAFNAGNDVLMLSEFGLNPRVEQTNNIADTVTYFRQLYDADPGFAARVDAAVLRILTMKLRLYDGAFSAGEATLPVAGIDVLMRDQEDVMNVAQSAAALISPSMVELAARAPEPPAPTERIVFITDVRLGQQCSTCPRSPLLDRREMEMAVLQIYGPEGSGQARPGNLQSYTFEELAAYLDNPSSPIVGPETPTPSPAAVGVALAQADWVVFSMLDVTAAAPASRVVSTFLSQQAEIVRAKKVVVMAFDGPYFLDATDLSNLTAYYALYSRAPEFVLTAARLLYRDLTPSGSPAVSVAGIGYNIRDVTRPDPNSRIELFWEVQPRETDGTPEPAGLELGDTITVTTGVLRDRNGHQVPDQTRVRFRLFYPDEGLEDPLESPTVDGVASVTLLLNRPGRIEIDASSEPATLSDLLRIDVQQDSMFFVTEIVPSQEPTATATATETPVPPTATPTPTATQPVVVPEIPRYQVNWGAFFVMCLGLAVALVGGYRLGAGSRGKQGRGVRLALAGAIGVLAGYNYFALVLPGSVWLRLVMGNLAAPVSAALGGLLGFAVGWYLFMRRK